MTHDNGGWSMSRLCSYYTHLLISTYCIISKKIGTQLNVVGIVTVHVFGRSSGLADIMSRWDLKWVEANNDQVQMKSQHRSQNPSNSFLKTSQLDDFISTWRLHSCTYHSYTSRICCFQEEGTASCQTVCMQKVIIIFPSHFSDPDHI